MWPARASRETAGAWVVRPQDRPAGEEGGPQGRQRSQRDVPQAPLGLPDQIVQEADEAEGRLGPREAPGAHAVVLTRRMREWLQDLLDAVVNELLGRPKSARRKLGWAIRYNGSSHTLPWTKHAFAAVWASHTQSLTMAGAKKIVARRAQ